MGRIDERFANLKSAGHSGFIPYIMAGDPSLDTTVDLVLALEHAGADVIELGMPFSDPLADGPTIQAAGQRALANGTTVADVLKTVEAVRRQSTVPMILMAYCNPVYRYGLKDFVTVCADTGLDGMLLTDLPPEEASAYKEAMHDAGLDTIFLLAPTSREARIKTVTEASTGFVYYVSRAGVTGERHSLSDSLGPMVGQIRSHTDLPIAVGFGISTPEHARAVAELADAAVVGSAIVRRIGEGGSDPHLAKKIGEFAAELAGPLKG